MTTHNECTKSRMEKDDSDEGRIVVSFKKHGVFQDGGEIYVKYMACPRLIHATNYELSCFVSVVHKRLCHQPRMRKRFTSCVHTLKQMSGTKHTRHILIFLQWPKWDGPTCTIYYLDPALGQSCLSLNFRILCRTIPYNGLTGISLILYYIFMIWSRILCR